MQKKPYYCSFACRRTQTESQAQRGEKRRAALLILIFLQDSAREAKKEKKKNLLALSL